MTMEHVDSHEERSSPTSSTQLHDIVTPHHNDVLFGRGVTCNRWKGNEQFRHIVAQNKELYLSIGKREKMSVSRAIVAQVRSMDPPGRFLERDPETGRYFDVGDKKAIEKTSQALRDGTSSAKRDAADPSGRDGKVASVPPVQRGLKSHVPKEKNSEPESPTKTKGVKRLNRKAVSTTDTAVRRRTLSKNHRKSAEEGSPPQSESPPEVPTSEALMFNPTVSPRRSVSEYPAWPQHPQHRSNSFGGMSAVESSVVSLPSPSYNESYAPTWAHRRLSYPYQQAHRVSMPSQDVDGAPVWSSSDDALGGMSSLPPVSPSSIESHNMWHNSMYGHGHNYPPAIPSLRAWSSDSGLPYNHGIHQTHVHSLPTPSWRPLPQYGTDAPGAPPLVTSTRMNLPHPMIDDSPAPFVIRRSGGRRFCGATHMSPPATHSDFTPPPSPSRRKRESRGAVAAELASTGCEEPVQNAMSPPAEVQITPERPTESPSEMTEENDESCFLKDPAPPSDVDSYSQLYDVVSPPDECDPRPSEIPVVGAGDYASASDTENRMDETPSLSPLPFRDEEYNYGDGNLIMDLTEELLCLPMDSV